MPTFIKQKLLTSGFNPIASFVKRKPFASISILLTLLILLSTTLAQSVQARQRRQRVLPLSNFTKKIGIARLPFVTLHKYRSEKSAILHILRYGEPVLMRTYLNAGTRQNFSKSPQWLLVQTIQGHQAYIKKENLLLLNKYQLIFWQRDYRPYTLKKSAAIQMKTGSFFQQRLHEECKLDENGKAYSKNANPLYNCRLLEKNYLPEGSILWVEETDKDKYWQRILFDRFQYTRSWFSKMLLQKEDLNIAKLLSKVKRNNKSDKKENLSNMEKYLRNLRDKDYADVQGWPERLFANTSLESHIHPWFQFVYKVHGQQIPSYFPLLSRQSLKIRKAALLHPGDILIFQYYSIKKKRKIVQFGLYLNDGKYLLPTDQSHLNRKSLGKADGNYDSVWAKRYRYGLRPVR